VISSIQNSELSIYSKYLYECTNIILNSIYKKIALKIGDIDIKNNYYNKWYINPYYFNGIEKIVQNIVVENDTWNFGRSLVVIARIF
jgi:hypothetical protein